MSTTNRTALLNKAQRVLKKTYKYVPVRGEQPLMETLLFASCLENAHHDQAAEALEKVRGSFFDWNEIRVSTVKELAEAMPMLVEPQAAAARLKGVLQSVFESDYTFDLEHLKKQNLGAAIKKLQKLPGTTPFTVAYATQIALKGHSIPLDRGTLDALVVLGVISPAEAANGSVPGLERVISKAKGPEFGALLHELGADFAANPFSPQLRELLLSIAPDAKERFPKRTPKKAPEPTPPPAPPAPAAGKKAAKRVEPPKKATGKAAEKRPTPVAAPKAAAAAKKKAASRPKKAAAKSLSKRKPR
jgi:endonuclease-3